MAAQKFKVGDLVTINPVRKNKYREGVRDSIGKVCDVRGSDRLTYLVFFEGRNGAHMYRFTAYDLRPAAVVTPTGAPKVESKEVNRDPNVRKLEVDIVRAKAWYHSDNEDLQALALKLFSEDELKCSKPRSWEELCDKYTGEYWWREGSNVSKGTASQGLTSYEAVDTLPTKELLDKHTAMGQLLFAHHIWTGGWKPDWDSNDSKFCICTTSLHRINIIAKHTEAHPLHFRTFQDALDFSKTFKSLIDTAYGLF